MALTDSQVADINMLAAFLSLDHTQGADPGQLAERYRADILILLGNAVLATDEQAFSAMAAGVSPMLLIAGGVGHATELLYGAVARHPVYGGIATAGRSEAEILRDIGRRFFGLDDERILLETQSTNCGENARMARLTLDRAGLHPDTVILTQDPLMQRRTDATFRRVWRDRPAVRFIDWPTLSPRWQRGPDGTGLRPQDAACWPEARFISLLLGEIPRLRDGPGGYGPGGADFIEHVDIPSPVEAAYDRLAAALGANYGDRVI
ncbi:YdcF family protein [Martelella alba]|uniref:YdcF family protein n=1 Tax=Martelella alba TaxID=2590451 RepID=A0ABY2SKH3_9HYPH|nr:YdcF family protein [Martelella alba]TKI05909.1 YdcF family protein [Martelella alba]